MLTIHRSERADALMEPLADLLSHLPVDPFVPEVIAVPSKGVERWVMQQLSLSLGAERGRDGVAANIVFPNPSQLFGDVMSSLAGWTPTTDPWTGSRLVWAILALMDESYTEPWAGMLAHHLGCNDPDASHRQGRRFSTASKLAQLFTSYGEARPSMIVDWFGSADTDGFGVALRDDMLWQADFWRRLRDRIGSPSPAERLADACETLREQPHVVDLPTRLSVFGPTRLTRSQLAVFDALAAGRELHLWLTHPSPTMWQTLQGLRPAIRRAEDRTALQVNNPLLTNLSRDVRELQQLLSADAEDLHHPPESLGDTVLRRMQDDIRLDRDPAKSAAPLPLDGSIAIHACHGHVRQVEVLREALLHLFNEDPTLQARDVIVLCPDVDAFAPLIAAAFGPTNAPHPGHRLRVRLADRGPARTNPLLQTLQTLLALADGRVTASEVLDLIAVDPVARRFGFSESDVETLRRWVADGGARWGIGEDQRELFGLAGIRQNTFGTARDRLLLGVSADESDLVWLGTALPLDDVESSDVDLAGRYAEFLDRLDAVLAGLRGPHTTQVWSALLAEALDLLTQVGESDVWQRNQAGRFLGEVSESAGDTELTLPDMRAVLAAEFRPRPTRSNFRTGEITVATLVPMRFVPHRVVAVIGLDDEAFPRVAHVEGDDVLALDPCLGERDPRSEDRQLLLDALMSATDHLLFCYTGADPVSGAHRPPPAPLADVIDAVTATVEPGATVVTRQPLQPFDAANFVVPQPFSFDCQAHRAAVAARLGTRPVPDFVPEPLAPVPEDEVTVDELVDFFADPTMGFLRQRLGVSFPRNPDEVADALPLTVAGLPSWHIGERLLREVLAGATMDAARQAELRRGTLPPGRLGIAVLDEISTVVTALSGAAVASAGDQERRSVHVGLDLGLYRLTGTIGDVYGTTLISTSYSTLTPKHRIAGWVRLLALCAHGLDCDALVIGRHNQGGKEVALSAPTDPTGVLAGLLDIRAAGLREPLPLGPETSYAYAARRKSMSAEDAHAVAAKAWTSTSAGAFRNSGENDEKSISLVYGSDAPFSVWWDQSAPASEHWSAEEPSNRFAQLALRVFGPLFDHEQFRMLR
ncbi:MAG: exodeoxyribonuclease V subunit gamma [Fimbriimonadaceae bacterium]|nr:exodeoxyribonuclease V subunit gamma [Fimbriimonadaceae bacterium]